QIARALPGYLSNQRRDRSAEFIPPLRQGGLKSALQQALPTRAPSTAVGVGRAALLLPLPPNRTGGFPASGFPVSGVSARLHIGTRAVFQTKQPLPRKPSVGPPSAVGLAQPVAGPFLPFAQQRPQASPH